MTAGSFAFLAGAQVFNDRGPPQYLSIASLIFFGQDIVGWG